MRVVIESIIQLRLNLDLLQLKWFFNYIFGFSILKSP